MAKTELAGHLVWKSTRVDGRRAVYGVAGHGLPVLFLHGWALGSHAYKRPLKRLARLGCRVYAPALPNLGGTEGLPRGYDTLGDYAGWVDAFLSAVGVDEPVLAVGHSLGGAVATRLTHDYPDRVSHLVLVNALGASLWTETRTFGERPLWNWAASFVQDIIGSKQVVGTVKAIAEDCVPNLVHNPLGLMRVAAMARRVDLVAELGAVRESGVGVTVVSSEGDLVLPAAGFREVCRALGVDGRLVPGGHSWLLAEPEEFIGAVVNAVGAAMAARAARHRVVSLFPDRPLAASG
ncbi:MAG TPA: alpha/beta hydrolase [Acidimicrobiales bacterium]|jgi:pimeloyl-ACP methyl ester carboxylesterase|nr:alpha/beta hydrolase [Acidimicrobiales bacterium]